MPVQFHAERLRGELRFRNVRQHTAGVDVDSVSARRLDDGHAMIRDVAAEVCGGRDAVPQVIGIENLVKAHGDRIEVTSGQPAVCGETFGQDEQLRFLLGEAAVVRAKKTSYVREGVFLGGKCAAIGQAKHSLRNFSRRRVRVTCFPLLDKPGVLGETAGVQIERNPVPRSQFPHRGDVLD